MSSTAAVLERLLCCPRCEGSVVGMRTCSNCGVAFPQLGGVPVLLPDAEAAMQRWRLRARQFADGVEQGIASARAELDRPDLLNSTRARIAASCEALTDNRARVLRLLADAGIVPAEAGEGEIHTEDAPSAAGYRGITEYYEQLHRDWGWGQDDNENARSCEQVASALGPDPGVTVVLGAGAGRLAYDVHRACSPSLTLALDINPLLTIVASAMARGELIELHEFPLIPRDIDHVHLLRRLEAPHGAVADFQVVLGDAFALPLSDGVADTVVTPWFIDQVPDDARQVMAVAHRLLKPGGCWLNFGPLIYPKDRPYSTRYTLAELMELIGHSGFDAGVPRVELMEFLRSPAAGFARIEQVATIRAIKREASDEEQLAETSWLVAPHLPVPRFAGLDAYQPPHPLLGHVAALIDGKTSLAAITEHVIRDHGIPTAVAKAGVPAAAHQIARRCRELSDG